MLHSEDVLFLHLPLIQLRAAGAEIHFKTGAEAIASTEIDIVFLQY